MKRELQEWSERNGLGPEIPNAWQLLHIDISDQEIDADSTVDLGINLAEHERLGMTAGLPRNASRTTIARALAEIPQSERELADWLPDDWNPPIMISHYSRADVRAVSLLALPEIHRALTSALARLGRAETSGGSPVPLIVASSLGRTGSALLRDVLETLDQIDPTVAGLAVPIVLTPDALGTSHESASHATTSATLNELLNLSWALHGDDDTDPADPDRYPPRRRHLRRSLLPDAEPVNGPSTQPVYLIGSRNDGRSSRTGEHPYGAIASLVATIAIEPNLIDALIAERLSGWGWAFAHSTQNVVDVVTNRGAPEQVGTPIIDALGHARVSAGTHLLRRYAMETLAAAAAERLIGEAPESIHIPLALESQQSDDTGWIADISERVITAVEDVAAARGLHVASASVRQLITDTAARPEPDAQSLVELLLEPLLRALEDGTSQIASWSRDMAYRTQPAEDGLTVIEPHELPAILTDLLIATFGADESTAMQRAARDIGLGTNNGLRLITITRQMQLAGHGSARDRTAHPLVAKMHCRTDDLLARADRWLIRDGTPTANFLAHDLRSIVSVPDGTMPGGSSIREREDRLITLIREALPRAAPRVTLDEHLMMLLHPRLSSTPNVHLIRWFGKLPFRGHALESRLLETLQEMLCEPLFEDPEFILTAGPAAPHLDIFTTLRHRVDVSVVSSLMHPIAAEWRQANGDERSARQFLMDGHARPLAESLPLPTAHLRAMIRGWFTGRALGLIEASLGTDRSAIVLDPLCESRRVTFIAGGTLQAANTMLDVLTRTLGSIIFAQLEIARTGSFAPLDAHLALRDLGMSDPSAPEVLRYPTLAPVLAGWIETDVVHGGDILPDAALHRSLAAADGPEARREALADLFESIIADVERFRREHVAEHGPRPRHWREAPAWLSIDDHILAALAALVRATRGHIVKRSSSSG